MTRYLLVANATARSGKAQGRIRKVRALMEARGIAVDLLPTEPEGRTVEAVAAAVRGTAYDVVVSMGGDGTFREVATGIMRSGTGAVMGMLPSGTANDLGRSFGIKASTRALRANLDVMAAGHITKLDAGVVRCLEGGVAEATFFDSVGWGIQSDILAQRNRDREIVAELPILRSLYKNQLVYAGAAVDRLLGSWAEPVKFGAIVHADGEVIRYDGLTDLIVKGVAVYGGAWVLARESEPDDGMFELVPIQGRREWASKALRDLLRSPLLQGHLDLIGISHSVGASARHFEVEFTRAEGLPVSCQVDGDEWRSGYHFEVEVIPGAVALLTRADFVPRWKLARF